MLCSRLTRHPYPINSAKTKNIFNRMDRNAKSRDKNLIGWHSSSIRDVWRNEMAVGSYGFFAPSGPVKNNTTSKSLHSLLWRSVIIVTARGVTWKHINQKRVRSQRGVHVLNKRKIHVASIMRRSILSTVILQGRTFNIFHTAQIFM